MSFFETLLNKYAKIKFPEQYSDIAKADKAISWYLSDSTDQYVTIMKDSNVNIIEVDIRQAFTTICRCLFEPTNDFIIEMNKIEDKKSRNIFIATSLVNTEYLHLLNIISKIIIFGTLFEIGDITLLELKKDGATIVCNDDVLNKFLNINDQSLHNNFLNFVLSNKFEFHISQYEKYIRSNKTSYIWDGKDLIIKGVYKHCPNYLKNIQKKIIQNTMEDFNDILKIYSRQYFDILLINNLNELLNEYYICDNKRYLAEDGKYIIKEKDGNINPRNYIKTFIYPILLSMKL